MKMTNVLGIALIMSTLFLISCDETADECLSLEEINTFDVTLSADTINLNESVDIEVGIHVVNGCGDYHSTIITENGNTVDFQTKAIYTGCICTEAIEYRTGTVTYTPTSTGMKVLRFDQDDNQVLTDTLIVQ